MGLTFKQPSYWVAHAAFLALALPFDLWCLTWHALDVSRVLTSLALTVLFNAARQYEHNPLENDCDR